MPNTNMKSRGLSEEERSAMKEAIKERNAGKAVEGEGVVLEKIAKLPEPDRTMAKKVHAIIMKSVPGLVPRLWYGMPAYSKDGKTICFFQDAHKFKTRYATLGFSDKANLDEGNMWPNSYALNKLTAAEEKRIAELVKRAVR